jgi:hypothetical protein
MFRRLLAAPLVPPARARLLVTPEKTSAAFVLGTCIVTGRWYVTTKQSTGTGFTTQHDTPKGEIGVPSSPFRTECSVAKNDSVGEPFRVRVRDLVGPLVNCNQAFRMPTFDEEVEIYPSPGREKLWSVLDEKLRALDGKSTAVTVGMTGISGCGKSHALLWWAKEQMDRGHLVLYVQNADCFERRTWGLDLYNVLQHAVLKMWRHWGLNGAALTRFFPDSCSAIDDLGKLWTKLSEAVVSELEPSRGAVELHIKNLNSMLNDAHLPAPGLYSRFFRILIERVLAVADCPQGAFIHSIFIIDQDNRLQKAMLNKTALALSANAFVSNSPCLLTVLCASANNEGWEKRVSLDMIQVYPEPVPMKWIGLQHLLPLEVLLKILKLDPGSVKSVADAIAAVPAFFKKLEELTNFYPLELRLFSKLCARQPVVDKPDGWKSVLMKYQTDRGQQIRTHMRDFIYQMPKRRRAMWEALKGLQTIESPYLDRRYVSALSEDGVQQFVTPLAWTVAWEVLEQAYASFKEAPREDPDRGAFYESRVKERFLIRDVLRLDRADERLPIACHDLEAVFEAPPDPFVVHVVRPSHQMQRAFDFTLITGTWGKNSIADRRFCVIFVQCCSGYQHKDSFRDLVLNGDSYWQRMLPPGKCYLAYLWITPTRLKKKGGVEKKVVTLALDDKQVLFEEFDQEWYSVIDINDHSRGRTADAVAKGHGWRNVLAFDEMHRSIPFGLL